MAGLVVPQPAADIDRLRGHRRRGVANQVTDEARDFLGSGVTAHRDLRLEALEYRRLGGVVVGGITLPHPLSHRGLDVAGADGVDGDAGLGELEAERLGEADDAVLGGGVGSAKHYSLLAAGRCDVDNPPPAALKLPAGLEYLPGNQENAVQVGVDDVVPEFVGDLRRHAAAAAGVVHQYVDVPVPLYGRADEVLDVSRPADVGGDAIGLVALRPEFADRLLDCLGAS